MAQANLKFLQPEKLAIDPSSSSADDDWKFWFKMFSNFINVLPGGEVRMVFCAVQKLDLLTTHLTIPLHKLIQEETTYERVIETLQKLFVKQKMKSMPGIFQPQHDKTLVNLLMSSSYALTN